MELKLKAGDLVGVFKCDDSLDCVRRIQKVEGGFYYVNGAMYTKTGYFYNESPKLHIRPITLSEVGEWIAKRKKLKYLQYSTELAKYCFGEFYDPNDWEGRPW